MNTIFYSQEELWCYVAVTILGLYLSIVYAPMAAIPVIPSLYAMRRELRRE